MYRFQQLISCLPSTILALTGTLLFSPATFAQPSCEPPPPGEYLLLIVTETTQQQEQVRQTLPGDIESSVCRYINDTVTRVGGFADAQIADDWARYMQELIQLPSYVVEGGAMNPGPAGSSSLPPTASLPSVSPGNPQLLGPGYAVLVDYFNRPEVAGQVQQLLGTPVNLVSYGQRPYLLAIYTSDQNAATATMQTLNQQGFWALLVESHRVTLLGRAVVN